MFSRMQAFADASVKLLRNGGIVGDTCLFYCLFTMSFGAQRTSAAVTVTPRYNPHSPSTPCGIVAFSVLRLISLRDIALSCPLDYMSCSVALEVMPHSATSRATGDDMSVTAVSNAGVKVQYPEMCV
jgi:hypothetical protein